MIVLHIVGIAFAVMAAVLTAKRCGMGRQVDWSDVAWPLIAATWIGVDMLGRLTP